MVVPRRSREALRELPLVTQGHAEMLVVRTDDCRPGVTTDR